MIPLSRPDIGQREKEYVSKVLDSGQLAFGQWVERFEHYFRERTDRKYAIAVNSGTAALHLATSGLGIWEGDEVITSPFSFIASANCIRYAGATPRFVDVDPDTGNLDPDRIQESLSEKTRAILAVDVFGVPARWQTLTRFAKEHDLLLIADACESLGAVADGRPAGSWGDAAAFGFYPNKQITTGEGGILVTDSESLFEYAVSARNQGRSNVDQMHHVRFGYNYRLTDLAAAIGCAQMERLDDLLQQRHNAARAYNRILAPYEDRIETPQTQADSRSWFVYPIRLRKPLRASERDKIITGLKRFGIGSASYFPSIHLQPVYQSQFGYKPGTFPCAEDLSERTLVLPFFTGITQDQQTYVAETLGRLLQTL